MLGFQHLHLQRHRQTIFRTAVAQPDQRLAAFEHGPAGQRLQPVEVGQASGIGLSHQSHHRRWMASRWAASATMRLRLDAGTDGIGDVGFQPAAAQALRRTRSRLLARRLVLGVGERRDRTGVGDTPGQRAPATAGPVVDRRAAEHAATDSGHPAHQKPLPVVTRICRGARGHRPVATA